MRWWPIFRHWKRTPATRGSPGASASGRRSPIRASSSPRSATGSSAACSAEDQGLMMRRIRTLFAVGAGLLLSGRVSSLLAQKVVSPPNKSGLKPLFAHWEALKDAPEAFADAWSVDVGPPAAKISVASLEPGDYGLVYDMRLSYPQNKSPNVDFFNAYWKPAKQVTPWPGPPRGTVLLLHGYLQNKNYVTP